MSDHPELNRGSSPRGRGTALVVSIRRRQDRFIPAWAGNRPCLSTSALLSAVHPRVGGEQASSACTPSRSGGSSPRGRGTDNHRSHAPRRCRFIPAWAGNSNGVIGQTFVAAVHPRVGGEQDRSIYLSTGDVGSSPRGRGTEQRRRPRDHEARFIPAWAGNSFRVPGAAARMPVHPRVGGEQRS